MFHIYVYVYISQEAMHTMFHELEQAGPALFADPAGASTDYPRLPSNCRMMAT